MLLIYSIWKHKILKSQLTVFLVHLRHLICKLFWEFPRFLLRLLHQICGDSASVMRCFGLRSRLYVFEESKTTKETARREQEAAEEKAMMLKTIGQLTVERDFLMKEAHELNRKVRLRQG